MSAREHGSWRRRRGHPLWARVGVLLGALVVAAAWVSPSLWGSQIADDVKASIRARVDQGLNVGIVLGVVSPVGVEFYAYGSMAAGGDVRVDEKTLFEIGSVGKTFTAVLLADAVERGEVSLDAPIRLYLPEAVTVPTRFGPEITPAHLVTHTSGLPPLPDNFAPADELNPYADYTVDLLYQALENCTLTSLGTKYSYSNLGFGLLGHILERASGLDYDELLVRRLATPLGLASTVMTPTEDMADRMSTGYRETEAMPRWDNPTLAGAGGGVSTAQDLAVFLAANLGLVDAPLAETMAVTHEPRAQAGALEVGMAWHIRWTPAGNVVEHHGATGGAWSYVGFIEEKQLGVVVLTNSYEDIDELGLHVLDPSYALHIHGEE